MSDAGQKPPPKDPARPAGAPTQPRTQSGQIPAVRRSTGERPAAGRPPSRPPTLSGTVQTAARASPLVEPPKGPAAQRIKDGLKEGAVETALNLRGALRDLWDGFQASSTYFKYRVFIVAAWAVLSMAGLGAACRGVGADTNSLGARLVVTTVNGQPVYMLVNDSTDPWDDVRLVMNDRFSAAATKVAPGAELTIGVRKLIDATGKPAPDDVKVDSLVLKTSDDKVTLIREGKYLFDAPHE